MIILSWNYRGLGNLQAVPSLCDLIRSNKPDVLFLCETIVSSSCIEELCVRLGFAACFAVDCQGRSGGLALFWSNNACCTVMGFSPHFINVDIADNPMLPWKLTCFYGILDRRRR